MCVWTVSGDVRCCFLYVKEDVGDFLSKYVNFKNIFKIGEVEMTEAARGGGEYTLPIGSVFCPPMHCLKCYSFQIKRG